MRARFIPFALIWAMVLVSAAAGCDSGSGIEPTSAPTTAPASTPDTGTASGTASITDSGPPHPASPTVPADVPTTGPNLVRKGERPPVMPLEATQNTRDGAVAFAKFFVRTIDWGFATTNGSYMRHYFESGCVECRSHANGLDNTRRAGDHYLGSRFTITGSKLAAVGSHRAEQSVIVTFDLTSVEVVNKHNVFVNGDIARRGERRQLWLAWRSAGWSVVDMRPVSR